MKSLFFAGCVCVALLCSVNGAEPVYSSSFHVKEFGAKGDGVADDGPAIARAVAAAREQHKKFRKRRNSYLQEWSSPDSSYGEVVFSEGTYRISRPVVADGAYFRGIGKAEILQTDPESDILYFGKTTRCHVENLAFRGGRIQIYFWTDNLNTSRMTIRNCRFRDSSGYAVTSVGYAGEYNPAILNRSRNWAPYEQKTGADGLPELTRNTSETAGRMENSTIILLDQCRWENCRNGAELASDQIVIRNSSAVTSPEMEGGLFKLRGQATVRDTQVTVKSNPAKKQSVITHDATLFQESADSAPGPAVDAGILECVRLTMQSDGQGIPLVRSYAIPRYMPRGIHVRDSVTDCGNGRENAIVYLEHQVPETLLVQNVEERGKHRVRAVAVADPENAERLAENRFFKQIPVSEQYKFALGENGLNVDNTLPEGMEPFQEACIPNAVLSQVTFPFPGMTSEELKNSFSERIDAEKAGITRKDARFNNPEYATRRIQELLDSVSGKNAVIVFPPEEFELLKPLVIRGNLRLTSAGNTVFTMIGGISDCFRVSGADRFAADNLTVLNGRSAFVIYPNPETITDIALEDCTFRGNSTYSVRCIAGDGESSETNRTRLRMENNFLYSAAALESDCADVLLDSGWIAIHGVESNRAFIINRGGRMIVANQIAYELNGKTWLQMKSPWKDGKNNRMIDNYGSLQLLYNRCSGETGGFPALVYQCGQGGTVFIDGGFHSYLNPASKRCMVYYRELPELTVLRSVGNQQKEMGYIMESRLRKTERSILPDSPEKVTIWKTSAELTETPVIHSSGLKTRHVEEPGFDYLSLALPTEEKDQKK